MKPRLYLVAYDIADPSRLRRVAREMEAAGDRMQKSVFECGLTSEAMLALRARLKLRIEPTEDKLCYLPICEPCRRGVLFMGKHAPFSAEPFWIV